MEALRFYFLVFFSRAMQGYPVSVHITQALYLMDAFMCIVYLQLMCSLCNFFHRQGVFKRRFGNVSTSVLK